MTNPNAMADKVVADIQANATALASLGTGAVAADIIRYSAGAHNTNFWQAIQDIAPPGALVAVTGADPGPGEGVWRIVQIAIYVRIGAGGDSWDFWNDLLTDVVDGLEWQDRCLIDGATRQPALLKKKYELFGVSEPLMEIPVIRMTVEDIDP